MPNKNTNMYTNMYMKCISAYSLHIYPISKQGETMPVNTNTESILDITNCKAFCYHLVFKKWSEIDITAPEAEFSWLGEHTFS